MIAKTNFTLGPIEKFIFLFFLLGEASIVPCRVDVFQYILYDLWNM